MTTPYVPGPSRDQSQASFAPDSTQARPTPHKRSKAPWVIAVATAVILFVAAGAAWLLTRDGQSPPAPSGTLAIKGTLTLDRGQFIWGENGGTQCNGWRGYDDIHTGTQITVTNAAGEVIALGQLGYGKARPDTDPTYAIDCTFEFVIANVPGGHGFYGIEVGKRGIVRYQESQVSDSVQLSIG